jgi:hypothetical protein
MSEQIQQPEEKHYPVKQSAAMAGGTAASMLALDLLAHFGPTGLVVGGIASYVAWKHGPEILEQVQSLIPQRYLPEPQPKTDQGERPEMDEQQPTGDRSFWDRALGHHPKRAAEPGQNNPNEIIQGQQPGHAAPTGNGSYFERFPVNETMRLGVVAETGQRFDPHIDWFFGDGGIIAGQPGAGKSNLIGLMATSSARCGLATIILDYKREFYTLREVVEDSFCWAGHESFASEAGDSYYSLNKDNARELAEIITAFRFTTVVDVPSYAGRANDLAETITALLNGLMDVAQHTAEHDRLPCLIFVDEAHNFWPEERKLSAFSTIKKENFDALQGAHNRIVTGGRSYGYTMYLATQRLPNIAKWAIAPLQLKIVMRHRETNDLKRCKEETGLNETTIASLDKGQGIVMGLTDDPTLVNFDKQEARHVSVTPTIQRIRERRQEPRTRVSQVLKKQAQEVYEPGTSHHDLARILDTDKETAIELLRLLKRATAADVSASGSAGNGVETGMETAQEALSPKVSYLFGNTPNEDQETPELSGENTTASVSEDIRETIKRARSRKPQPMPHRQVAELVGLSGRKYDTYRKVCQEMGLMSNNPAEAAE